MTATRFKVGDKVRVRKGLKPDHLYGGLIFTNFMETLVGKTSVVTDMSLGGDAYLLSNYNNIFWTDEMLEPVEKTLDNLCAGDFIRSGSGIRKILAAVDGCYLLSRIEEYTSTGAWYTVNELVEAGYSFIKPDTSEFTIEIDGKKYKKADVEEAIKDLEVVD